MILASLRALKSNTENQLLRACKLDPMVIVVEGYWEL